MLKAYYSGIMNVVNMMGEGTLPLPSRGSGGVSPPSSGEIDPIFTGSEYYNSRLALSSRMRKTSAVKLLVQIGRN
jgi:hypothetical protein